MYTAAISLMQNCFIACFDVFVCELNVWYDTELKQKWQFLMLHQKYFWLMPRIMNKMQSVISKFIY